MQHMRSAVVAGLCAGSLAATSGVAVATAATPSSAIPSSAMPSARVAGPAATTKTVTKYSDIDGDGRLDRITTSWITGTAATTVSVRTAKGVRSSLRLQVQSDIDDRWAGTAPVDGVRGRDIRILAAFGDVPHFQMLTWRKKLVTLAPPATRDALWMIVPALADLGIAQGYSFTTIRGVRRTVVWDLTKNASGRFTGTATSYDWTSRGWTRRATSRPVLTAAQANTLTNFAGLRFIL